MTTQNRGAGPGLRHGVPDQVRTLGDSPSEVAGRLGTHGVRGVPGQAGECAIARYLQSVGGAEADTTGPVPDRPGARARGQAR